jgi:hypothetical protein
MKFSARIAEVGVFILLACGVLVKPSAELFGYQEFAKPSLSLWGELKHLYGGVQRNREIGISFNASSRYAEKDSEEEGDKEG